MTTACFSGPPPRLPLIDALDAHARARPDSADVVRQMLDFLHRHGASAFERNNPEGHFCGSAWVVDVHSGPATRDQRVLLTHHRKLGRWLQLGGHADGVTDLSAVALAEAAEESGLQTLELLPTIFDVDIHEIPARPGEPAHLHLDVRYVVLADAREPLVTSAESHALAWVPVASLLGADTEPSIARMARYWCEAAA
jgi:ADP-ribose pyrophosphatase YjhB (NUDIX family)